MKLKNFFTTLFSRELIFGILSCFIIFVVPTLMKQKYKALAYMDNWSSFEIDLRNLISAVCLSALIFLIPNLSFTLKNSIWITTIFLILNQSSLLFISEKSIKQFSLEIWFFIIELIFNSLFLTAKALLFIVILGKFAMNSPDGTENFGTSLILTFLSLAIAMSSFLSDNEIVRDVVNFDDLGFLRNLVLLNSGVLLVIAFFSNLLLSRECLVRGNKRLTQNLSLSQQENFRTCESENRIVRKTGSGSSTDKNNNNHTA